MIQLADLTRLSLSRSNEYKKGGDTMKEDYPLLMHLDSWSRAALVTYLFSYALAHNLELGAYKAWLTAGQAFDPWADTLRR